MAASLSRPDPSSPASVAEADFSTSRRGYAPDEVRAFLTSVASELGRLHERERQLEAQVAEARVEVQPAPELDEETVAALVGEETLRVLQTARESASQIKIRAEEAAAKTLREANDEANRMRQDAEVEAARKRHDSASDAEAEVAVAKQQGREMVNEARAYRERVLADLERRTKLARQQIEDLVHGRDRLLQVFERARLVAVDVTSELQGIDGPEEFVNFSPTTGPLPLMVPATELSTEPRRPAGDDHDDEDDPAHDPERAMPLDDLAEVVTDDTGSEFDPSDDDGAADDAAAHGDDDHDDERDDDRDDEVVDPTPVRDANVVSLFRERTETARDLGHDDDPGDERDVEQDDGERPDVDGIFERLRKETPADETADAATDDSESDDVEPADEVDAGPTPFSRRDEAIVPLIVAGARKLKRVLADEQNGVLDMLRQKQPVTELDELITETDEHTQRYIEALTDELVDAAVSGAAEVGANDTKTLRGKLTKGDALVASHRAIRDDLVVPLRGRLERAIIDGNGDNEAITKRIRAVYREWKTQHIDDQLDDVFRFAHGGGISTAVKAGTDMVWVIDPTEPTCPDCEDNSLAGPVVAGDAFPTGHTSAPAHPGCRCLTVPAAQ